MKKAAQSVTNQRLIDARKQRGWLQREVADQIGTTRVNISRWEQGITLPSPYFRQRLCTLFEKNTSELGLLVDTVGKANEQVLSSSSNQDEVILNVPYQNPFFTGRNTVLTYLHNILHSNKAGEETQVQVISGLGGIGKTQTAIEYIYRYHEDYHTVLWIQAETPAMLIADLMAIANLLNILQKNEQDQQRVVYTVKRWLKSSKHWLLVLDNVGDFTIVNEIIPWKSIGHVILTTRAQSTGVLANHIDLKQMELDEAILFILRRGKFIKRTASLEDVPQTLLVQAKDVAIRLNCFPLALDQASAYIEDTGCSLSDYLDQYQIRRGILLDRRGSLVTDHPVSVSTTLFLCFKEVERTNLVAAEVLQLCAFLDTNAIPEEIITAAVREFASSLQSISTHFADIDNVLTILRKYSLLQRDNDTKMFSVHQLVQVVIKERMDKSMQRQWVECAVRVVNHAFPQGKEAAFWRLCQLCLIHVEACAELIEEWNLTFIEAGRLLHQAGIYLREHAQYMQAEKYLYKAKDIYEQNLEMQHFAVTEILNDLALLHWNQGQYMKAEEFYLRALTLCQQQIEARPLHMTETLNGLATLYHDQGRYTEAESFYRQALAIWEKQLELPYLGMVNTLSNLVLLYYNQEQYAAIEPFCQQVLILWEQLGEISNPDMVHMLNTIALLYHYRGLYGEAEQLYQQVLSIWEQQVGSEHPYTANTLSNLARLYVDQQRYMEARTLYQRALMIQEQKLELTHPHIMRTREHYNNLLELIRNQTSPLFLLNDD